MKSDSTNPNEGSVLIIALMTITIMTLICATSLFITSQNTSTGVQTAAWQQSLTSAEMGIDAAIRALNQSQPTSSPSPYPWTNWKTVSNALPTPAPSGGPVAGFTYEPTGGTAIPSSTTAPPSASQYYYLPSSAQQLSISYPNSEGTTSVSAWVTIDTVGTNLCAGTLPCSSTQQWYRIRSTGQTTFQSNSVYKRVSNNRLDNDLRNTITMNFNRKGNSNPGPTRTIEVVVQPIPQGGSARGITLANWLAMTGGGTADAFRSPTGQWSSAYRDTSYPLLVAEGATSNSAKFANTGQTYVYGGVVYSGTAPTNINANSGNPPVKDVMGQVSTPDNITIPSTSDPTAQGNTYNWSYTNPWAGTTASYSWTPSGPSAGKYATWTGGGGLPKNSSNATMTSVTANGTAANPAMVIINGDFTVPGGNTFTINATMISNPNYNPVLPVSPSNPQTIADLSNSYVTVWVQGKFTTSGSGVVNQASGTHVTWIVDNDITVSGDTYNNQNGTAANNSFIGVGNHKFTDSGSATFTGTVDAPSFSGSTISGSGDFTGAFIGSDLTISGSGSFHYDETLTSGSNPTIGNYAFASWFEDNSDPSHKDQNGNYIVY